MSEFVDGLGDRHQQTVDGVTTNYTLDLAAGLTQVLDDGTNAYLYGNGRIAQAGSTTEYFLGDALGSVRQLADLAGTVTLTQSYAPYGDVVSSVGTSQTSYAFTGENLDSNGLTYLRARYLDSSTGRFTQRDPSGLEANLYLYAGANPIVNTDPSGLLYNRQAAVQWAISHYATPESWNLKHVSDNYGSSYTYNLFDYAKHGTNSLCTAFVSMALWEGGVRDKRPDPSGGKYLDSFSNYTPVWWGKDAIRLFPDGHEEQALNTNYQVNEQSTTWANTNAFYNVLVQQHLSAQATVVLRPGYTIPRYKGESITDGTDKTRWEEQLRMLHNVGAVKPGDLVFYRTGGAGWDHVAMIIGWGPQTYYTEAQLYPKGLEYIRQFNCGNALSLKPRVVDVSGAIIYGSDGRSIDNTAGVISKLAIVHLH